MEHSLKSLLLTFKQFLADIKFLFESVRKNNTFRQFLYKTSYKYVFVLVLVTYFEFHLQQKVFLLLILLCIISLMFISRLLVNLLLSQYFKSNHKVLIFGTLKTMLFCKYIFERQLQV